MSLSFSKRLCTYLTMVDIMVGDNFLSLTSLTSSFSETIFKWASLNAKNSSSLAILLRQFNLQYFKSFKKLRTLQFSSGILKTVLTSLEGSSLNLARATRHAYFSIHLQSTVNTPNYRLLEYIRFCRHTID